MQAGLWKVEDVPGAAAMLGAFAFCVLGDGLPFYCSTFNSSLQKRIKQEVCSGSRLLAEWKFGSEQTDLVAFCSRL